MQHSPKQVRTTMHANNVQSTQEPNYTHRVQKITLTMRDDTNFSLYL